MASFNERLVQEVRKHGQLWNKKSKLHRDAVRRAAAWNDIASALGVTVYECQIRWRTIRDEYLKRKKRFHVKARGQWIVLDHEMSFLDDSLRPRTRSTLRPTADQVRTRGGRGRRRQSGESASAVPLPEAECAADDVTPPTSPLHPLPESVAQERSFDPEELFCLSLAPQLKRLPPRNRSKAEMWMLQILHGLEFGLYSAEVDPEAMDLPV